MAEGRLQLYSHASPNSFKVLLFLEESGVSYDIVPVDIYAGKQHEPEFLKINPNAKVPALRDGDVTVFDSNAILLYLAERTGQFTAKTPVERGHMISWLMFVASGLGPYSGQSVHFTKYSPEVIPYAKNRYVREAERHYRVMESRLKDVPYFAGATYTIADMAAWGWVNLSQVVLDGATLDGYPSVKRWYEGLNARPAAERAHKVSANIGGKTVLDDEARRLLFPQNAHLKQPA